MQSSFFLASAERLVVRHACSSGQTPGKVGSALPVLAGLNRKAWWGSTWDTKTPPFFIWRKDCPPQKNVSSGNAHRTWCAWHCAHTTQQPLAHNFRERKKNVQLSFRYPAFASVQGQLCGMRLWFSFLSGTFGVAMSCLPSPCLRRPPHPRPTSRSPPPSSTPPPRTRSTPTGNRTSARSQSPPRCGRNFALRSPRRWPWRVCGLSFPCHVNSPTLTPLDISISIGFFPEDWQSSVLQSKEKCPRPHLIFFLRGVYYI